MKRLTILALIVFVAVPLAASAGSFFPGSIIKAPAKVALEASPFDLKDVRLLDGAFRDAMRRNQKYGRPEQLTRGEQKNTVKFQALPYSAAGQAPAVRAAQQ